ncbi:mitochondrial carrier [Meredithblackwellia eburnea MCA 4105]
MAALPPSKPHQIPASWHLASGALSGAASVLTLQPLDLIKTRLQQDLPSLERSPIASTSKVVIEGAGGGGAGGARTVSLAAGAVGGRSKIVVWDTVKQIVRDDGLRGLWRGTTPTLYRNVPGVSLYFLTLSRLRTGMGQWGYFVPKGSPPPRKGTKVKLTPTGDLIVGSTARTGVGFVLMPFTLLKTISESTLSHSHPRQSSLRALQLLYASGGIKSLWRGAVPTAMRDAPGAGLFIVFYERGRRLLGGTGELGGGAVGGGMAGSAASLLSTLLTTPFDLLKTRRQLSPTLYTSLFQSISLVYRTSGIRGFWEGGGLRVVRKAGSAGIGWAVYEVVVGFAERGW